MKVAGRKNDGAWFRFNKFVKKANGETKQKLAERIRQTATLEPAFQALHTMAQEAGIDGTTGVPASSQEWAEQMASKGVARQVWHGTLSYDTYADGRKEHESPFFEFAKDLRLEVTKFMFLGRAVKDLANKASRVDGNPGGVADATPGT